MSNKTGNVEEICKEIEWEIVNFFSIAESGKDYLDSPSFSFANVSWYLSLLPRSSVKPGFMNLHLNHLGGGQQLFGKRVEFYYGFKKIDGSVEQLNKGTFEESTSHIDYYYFFKLSDIQQRKSELAPSDKLIITCTLKNVTTIHRNQSVILELPKLKNLISK